MTQALTKRGEIKESEVVTKSNIDVKVNVNVYIGFVCP